VKTGEAVLFLLNDNYTAFLSEKQVVAQKKAATSPMPPLKFSLGFRLYL
jgi:hypothetical protein